MFSFKQKEPGMEKRRFSRIAFEASAYLDLKGSKIVVQLIDISLKGALVLLEDKALDIEPKAAAAVLNIILNDSVVITMDVKIVHSAEGRLGLECVQIDIDSIAHLRRLVELNLGEESLLYRELKALIKNGD